MLDPMNVTLGHVDSSSLELLPKIFGLFVSMQMQLQNVWVKVKVTGGGPLSTESQAYCFDESDAKLV